MTVTIVTRIPDSGGGFLGERVCVGARYRHRYIDVISQLLRSTLFKCNALARNDFYGPLFPTRGPNWNESRMEIDSQAAAAFC